MLDILLILESKLNSVSLPKLLSLFEYKDVLTSSQFKSLSLLTNAGLSKIKYSADLFNFTHSLKYV